MEGVLGRSSVQFFDLCSGGGAEPFVPSDLKGIKSSSEKKEGDDEKTVLDVALDIASKNFNPYKYGVEIAIDIIQMLRIERREEEIICKSVEELFEITKSKIALTKFLFGNDYKEGDSLEPEKQADFESCKEGFFYQMDKILCGIKSSKMIDNSSHLLTQEGQNTMNGRTFASGYIGFLSDTKELKYILSLSFEELLYRALKHFKIDKKTFFRNSEQEFSESNWEFFKGGFIQEIKEIRKQNPHFVFTQKAQQMSEDELADLINSDKCKGVKVVEKPVISSKSKGKQAASEYFNNSPTEFYLNFLQFDEEKMDRVIKEIVEQEDVGDKEKFAESFKKHMQGIKKEILEEKKLLKK